jgi:tight adherence protein B
MPPDVLFTILTTGSVFLLVLSIWGIGLLLWSSRRAKRSQRIGNRLGLTSRGVENGRTLRLWLDGKEVETAVGWSASTDFSTRFANKCHDAGWESPPQTILLGLLGGMCGAFVLVLAISSSYLLSVSAAAIVAIGFWMFLNFRVARRRSLFDRQLIDALDLAARSLRVGHPLVGSLRLVSEEVAAPVGPLFAGIVQQQELGASMEDAIRTTAQNSSSDDLKLFATAVIIQLRSGGNLADMMERVASVMRDRLRLGRRVRVLITQAQFSKIILLALPPFMFVLLTVLNPGYPSIRSTFKPPDG